MFFTVEVDAHKIHFHYISNVFFRSFISVEEAGLVISSHCSGRDLVDLYAKGIGPCLIFTTQVDAFDLDVHVIK